MLGESGACSQENGLLVFEDASVTDYFHGNLSGESVWYIRI